MGQVDSVPKWQHRFFFSLSVLVTSLCRFNENADECTEGMGKMCVCLGRKIANEGAGKESETGAGTQ